MIWQDIVISVIQWVFALTLLPSVFSNDKPALLTSVLTGAAVGILAVTFGTLELWSAAISTGIVSVVWWVLAFQFYRRRATVRQEED